MNIEEKLFDYIEGKLTMEEALRLEKQIAKDPSLGSQIELIRKTDSLVGAQAVTPMEASLFTDTVMNRLETTTTRAKLGNRLIWAALGIFTAIFALAVSLLPLFPASSNTETIVPMDYLPSMPSFNLPSAWTTLQNPLLLQLVIVVNAIALLLAADRILSKRMNTNLKSTL